MENEESKKVILRLMGVQPGASEEQLARALQRIYKGKTEEELLRALMGLPLVISRNAPEEQAQKIKQFLETHGGIVKISIPGAPGTREIRVPTPSSLSVSNNG